MKVLLIVLAVLLVLLFLPFGAAIRYSQEGLAVWVKVWLLRFQILPAKEKKVKKKKRGKKPKEKAPREEGPAEERKKGGSLELVRAALPLVKPALAGLKRRLTVDDLELQVTWAAGDPADAAIGYGCANAALGTLWSILDQNLKVKKSRLGCAVDFDSSSPSVYLNAALSLNLWKTLTLAVPLLIRFPRAYRRVKGPQSETTKKEA